MDEGPKVFTHVSYLTFDLFNHGTTNKFLTLFSVSFFTERGPVYPTTVLIFILFPTRNWSMNLLEWKINDNL